MKNKCRNLKSNRGITLIALVITIIVLLILAGISIATLTGENGVLTKASTAKETNNKEAAREKLNIVLYDIQIDKISKGESVILNDELASLIESYDEITSAVFKGDRIETVVDGYTFEVNGKLGIDDKKEIAKVEPENPDDWDYDLEEIPGYAVLTRYKKAGATEVIVPNYIKGVPVKKVGGGVGHGISKPDWRFESYSIWLPDNCEVISKGTSSLNVYQNTIQKIIISEGITEIGFECFKNTVNLKEVIIPSSIEKIGQSAFTMGKNGEEFTLNIPKTVKELESNIASGIGTINVEYNKNEIPESWSGGWSSGVGTINYGVKM